MKRTIPTRRSNRQFLMVLGLALLFTAGTAGAQAPLWLGDWYPSLELQVTLDDNINRSFDGDGEKQDVRFEPSLRLERQHQLADYTFSYIAGEVTGAIYGKYEKLSHVAPGVDIGLRQQLGEGPNAPGLQAGFSLKYEFHQQDARFGAEFNPRVSAQIGLSPMALVQLYYEYDNRFAGENSVYDRDGHTFGVEGEVAVNQQMAIIVGYRYRRGDVLVHQPRTDLGEEIKGKRLPLDTFGDRYDAVKLKDGDTYKAHIGLRYAVTLYTALNIGYAYEEIKADGDTYPSNQLILGINHLL